MKIWSLRPKCLESKGLVDYCSAKNILIEHTGKSFHPSRARGIGKDFVNIAGKRSMNPAASRSSETH